MKYLFIILLFLVACQNEQMKQESSSAKKVYFDLAKMVQLDIDNNTQQSCGEEKLVSVNGNTESKSIDTLDWKKELQILLDCDINKPSWKGKYEVQILNDGQKYIYAANSSKIPVRKMTVNCEQKSGKVISVEIEKKTGTALFSNEQQIIYYPEKSFKIKASQRALFMKDFNSEVDVKFLCEN